MSTTLIDFISTSFQNVRSKERTDRLHKAVLFYLYDQRDDLMKYDVEFEYTMPDSYGGTFTVDIALLENGVIKKVVLCKALNSNISKNLKNLANTTVGESVRVCHADNEIDEVIFVTVLPEIAPTFKNDGSIRRLEDVVTAKKRTNISKVIETVSNGKATLIDIWYQIPHVRMYDHRNQFKQFTPVMVG